MKYDILVDFVYDDVKYVLYTDNTHNDKGEFNIYAAGVNDDGTFFEPMDVDSDVVFNAMIENYKKKIINGEI